MTRQDLDKYILDTYNARAEFLWQKTPTNAVYRHSENKKWFAATLTISKEKLGFISSEKLDILNVKCDPILTSALIKEQGIFPAYHMNKKSWVSIALDGSSCDEKIKFLLDMSYNLTKEK